MTTDPAKRTDRTARKATAEQVMELSRNLPLTRSVLRRAVENATPGQLGFLAALFTAENASRAESKRNRLLRQAGFPQSKELDGYDWSMAAFPTDWGREQLASLEFIDHAEDLVLYGDVGCGKTHLAIAIGTLACRRGIPVRFFTASGLIMRLRKAKTENRLDQELKTIGKADLLVIDELGYLPIDIDGARLLSPDHRRQLRKEKHHIHLEPRVRPMGRRVRRRRHGRRRHRPHRPPRPHHPIPRRILPKHPLTHEINNNQGNQPTAHTVQHERRQCPE